jgi:hypothetical protein
VTSGEMTGETKDVVLDVVRSIAKLEPAQRRVAVADVLDRLCWNCGSELPKFDDCGECGADRFCAEFSLSGRLAALIDEERKELFSRFCGHCGSNRPNCQCWNDE